MGNDRISALPDYLLTKILLDLPTKDSIKTGVLSTRWRNLWLSVPGLDLKVSDYLPLHQEVLTSFIETFMEFNLGSHLQKFKIKNDHFKYNVSSDWIATAVDRRVRVLDVEAKNVLFVIDTMPMNIFQSKTLVSLRLANVELENQDIVVSLPCLKIMHLDNICYGEDGPLIVEKLISGCPVLEDLTVVRIYYEDLETMPVLRVKSQTLKVFHYMFKWGMPTTYFSVEIDAPELKYMRFRDSQSDKILVKNLSSLFKIDLDTEFNVKFGGSPLESEDLRKRDIIRGFLTGISSVRHMIISQPTSEVLYHYSKLEPIPRFHNLSHLQAAFSSSSLQLLPAFLESCPNLKNLILNYSVSEEPEQIDFTTVPRCLISTLEYVEIKKLKMKVETGIKLGNYFLENSAVLKKLNLSFTDSPMANEESESYKKLLISTKLSPTCQVIID
ncbi:unnamed protein product [Arabidopsis halleri]